VPSLCMCSFRQAPPSLAPAAVEQVERMLRAIPSVENVLALVGYSLIDDAAQPNTAALVGQMRAFSDRRAVQDSVFAAIEQMTGDAQGLLTADVAAFNLPPIIGLGTVGGFDYQLQDLEAHSAAELGAVAAALVEQANQDPRLTQVFSAFSTTNPSLFLDVDRNKAQALGMDISDIAAALEVTLGGFYVNDFNLFDRIWQVNVQAEAKDRGNLSDLWRIHMHNAHGEMVPLPVLADVRLVLGPQTIGRYNNYRSVLINGAARRGVSSGEALLAMEELSRRVLTPGYGFEWAGIAIQEKQAIGQTNVILALAVVFAYLFLVVLRELGDPGSGPALGRRGRTRVGPGDLGGGTIARYLRADRPRGADRACDQKRYSDSQIR
jgi:multidrug efflux pump subunit AcrB